MPSPTPSADASDQFAPVFELLQLARESWTFAMNLTKWDRDSTTRRNNLNECLHTSMLRALGVPLPHWLSPTEWEQKVEAVRRACGVALRGITVNPDSPGTNASDCDALLQAISAVQRTAALAGWVEHGNSTGEVPKGNQTARSEKHAEAEAGEPQAHDERLLDERTEVQIGGHFTVKTEGSTANALDPEVQLIAAIALLHQGKRVTDIARRLGVHRTEPYRWPRFQEELEKLGRGKQRRKDSLRGGRDGGDDLFRDDDE